MQLREKREKYRSIIVNIINNRINAAINEIKDLATDSPMIISGATQQEVIYSHMLQFFAGGAQDPHRNKLKSDIKKKLYELADEAFTTSLSSASHNYFYPHRKNINEWNGISDGELIKAQELLAANTYDSYEELENLTEKIFHKVWFASQGLESETHYRKLIAQITNPDTPSPLATVISSALILRLLDRFDSDLFMALLDLYETQIDELWQRALMGCTLALLRYDHRIELYPEISARLLTLSDKEDFRNHMTAMAIQLIRTGDTEKITRRLQDDILPEMAKMAPKIKDKLSLDQLMEDDMEMDKNPEWEEFFSDSPDLYSKLEELSKLQFEGADVFISTFSNLKHYPFFKRNSNWFLPFIPSHPELTSNMDSVPAAYENFLETYRNSRMMCNSDKYSFCLNMQDMPEQQRDMLLQALSSELGEMNTLSKEDELMADEQGISVFHQFAQDLYRFYKIHPAKDEVENTFAMKKQVYQSKALEKVFEQYPAILKQIAKYYFDNEHFDHAANVFGMMENQKQDGPELFQKIAYANQMMGKHEIALEYYKKAELFDSNKLWNLKKIAACYKVLNNNEEAIKHYKYAEQIDQESIQIKLNIGNLYLASGDYENALDYYRGAEELRPSDVRTARPVAWCLLLKGELEAADLYYEQILQDDYNHYDLMNAGHLTLINKDIPKAIDFYKQSLTLRDEGFDDFEEALDMDKEHLLRLGVDEEDLHLLLDHLESADDEDIML